MPIEFRCTGCGRLLRTADGTTGEQTRCPECEAILRIPPPGRITQYDPAPPDGDLESPSLPEDPAGPASESRPHPEAAPPRGGRDEENPYQSPRYSGTYAGGKLPRSSAEFHAYAAARVSAPATGLAVTGALGLAIHLVGTIRNVLSLPMPGFVPDPDMAMISTELAVFLGVVWILLSVIVIVGAVKMSTLQSYTLAMTAAIVAMIPCVSCCVLGLPFGIWALVVLADRRVHAAFRSRSTG